MFRVAGIDQSDPGEVVARLRFRGEGHDRPKYRSIQHYDMR
jgi:hypothetical protein